MNTYECYYEDCHKIYNSKYNLIRHINSFHLDNKSYMCSYCSKGFYNKQCLDLHINTGMCDNFNLPRKGLGLLEDLSLITEAIRYKLQTPPPLQLPVLPKIEKDRQVPLHLSKLPIISLIFEYPKRN
ncbi:hypothetical protein SteCoe_10710 [Stentor coeruleus]|uniref:C2H2-type domain-containing protein n=1 Tax=Stentor coeruleus TaxID=5963 RepID=A0A1R2CF01_9CILI|nr:hypothetical protein SteCoe_10710 [Stentor coeruleus]